MTAFARGTCRACKRTDIPIRGSGHLFAHRTRDGDGCDGSHTLPATPPRSYVDYINAVAAASVLYEEGRNALRAACENGARDGGVGIPELARAADRPERFIQALIEESTL